MKHDTNILNKTNVESIVENIIEALSIKYREGLDKENKLKKEIESIYMRLQDLDDLSYNEHKKLTKDYEIAKDQLKKLDAYNSGLHDAREFVMWQKF